MLIPVGVDPFVKRTFEDAISYDVANVNGSEPESNLVEILIQF